MRIKNTGNNRTLEHTGEWIKMEIVKVQRARINRKEDTEAFFMFYWPSFVFFYSFIKMHNELDDFFHWNLRKLGENFHKSIFVMLFFLTWILFFINPVILNIKVFTPITKACFLSSLEPLTMSLSPIYIMQPACFPLSIHCTIPYFKRVIAADSQEEER